jgi:Ca-activated chloride channel family protein
MSDLDLTWVGGAKSETWPERLPDLYRGEPLVVLAKLDRAASAARLVGQRTSGKVSTELAFGRGAGGGLSQKSASERGLHRLWARRKIEGLMDRMIEGSSEEEVRPLVTALALEHHLMSKYTSLVAVDKVRSVETPGRAVAVANALPAGNTMFGNLPQTATPGPTCLLFSILSFASAWALLKRGGV